MLHASPRVRPQRAFPARLADPAWRGERSSRANTPQCEQFHDVEVARDAVRLGPPGAAQAFRNGCGPASPQVSSWPSASSPTWVSTRWVRVAGNDGSLPASGSSSAHAPRLT